MKIATLSYNLHCGISVSVNGKTHSTFSYDCENFLRDATSEERAIIDEASDDGEVEMAVLRRFLESKGVTHVTTNETGVKTLEDFFKTQTHPMAPDGPFVEEVRKTLKRISSESDPVHDALDRAVKTGRTGAIQTFIESLDEWLEDESVDATNN